MGTISLGNGGDKTARAIEVKQQEELLGEVGGNNGKEAEDPGIFHGAFSALTGLTIVNGHSQLPRTHSSDLAPVPRVSKLRLQGLIGFGVLHVK